MTVGQLQNLTNELSPDVEIMIVVGDVLFPIDDEECGATTLKLGENKGEYPALILTPRINV